MPNRDFIFVTGANSSIGQAIVQTLSCQYNIILHGRNELDMLKLKSYLPQNCEVKIFIADLSEVTTIRESLKDFIQSEKIHINGFVHCAGFLRILPLKHFGIEHIQEIFNINFFSAIEILKVLLSAVNNKQLKNIIFISALFSKRGDRGNSVYASSKGAIDTFVKSMALELAPRIRINSILPGAIETKMTAELFKDEKFKQEIVSRYPLGLGSAEDVAYMVDFLLSSNSKWITGQNYIIDGGRSCN